MSWFFAVLVVLLLGAVAVVAAGMGGSMTEVYDDRPDARVQAEEPLSGDDLRRVRFTTAFRGYRMSEVDTLLTRLADELDAARRDGQPARGPGGATTGGTAEAATGGTTEGAPGGEASRGGED